MPDQTWRSVRCSSADHQLKGAAGVFLAGQLAGVEGYVESAAHGLCMGLVVAEHARGRRLAPLPAASALGALLGHVRGNGAVYQPSNIVWSMFPDVALPENERKNRALRRRLLAERALAELEIWRSGPVERETALAAPA